jgi:hypothetical protein
MRAGRRSGALAIPPLIALTFLAGHPQEGFLLVLALSFRAVIDAIRSGGRPGLLGLARWAGLVVLGLGLAAVDLVPQVAIRPWTTDAIPLPEGSEMPRRYHLHLLNGLQLLSPNALGGPADYDGYDNYWETLLSIGLVPLTLAGIAMVSHPDRRHVRSWVLLAVLTAWVSAGRQFGLYALLYHLVPGMKLFRVPARPLFLTSLGGAVLAGLGVDAIRTNPRWRDSSAWKRPALGLALLGFLVLASAMLVSSSLPWSWGSAPVLPATGPNSTPNTSASEAKSFPDSLRLVSASPGRQGWGRERRALVRLASDPQFWIPLAAIELIVLGAWFARRPGSEAGRTSWVSGGLGLAAIAELAAIGVSLLIVAPADAFLGPDPIAKTLKAANRSGDSHDAGTAVSEPSAQPGLRIRARDAFYGDLRAVQAGLEKTNVNDLFQLHQAAALYETLYRVASGPGPEVLARLRRGGAESPAAPMDAAVDAFGRAVRQGVFDRMSVGWLVSDRIEPDPGWPVLSQGDWNGSSYAIQRNPTVLPRAYVVGRAEIVPDDAALIRSRFRDVDPREAVLMSENPLPAAASSDPTALQEFRPAEWISDDPARPVLQVETEAPCLLVLADSWSPGWSARVNGEPVEVLRGNYAQRVIPLPRAGRHVVELEFAPIGWTIGQGASLVSLLAWAALGRWGRRLTPPAAS